MKVLLVEDNEMNRDMLSRRLERKGHEVLIAVDGQEAIAMTREHRPAVVLMDMSLPVLDGWEATRRLKADEWTRGIPVIALTAHALPAERDRALEAGCVAFETKPIDFPKLLAVMEAVAR
ncbi:MAG: response regulator [Acidobacteria bacterium]|nr:response regulator [Acidobacteriota bacterium]